MKRLKAAESRRVSDAAKTSEVFSDNLLAGENTIRRWPMASINYRIRIQGHLAPEWSEWFGGMTIRRQPDGTTTLTGPVRD